MFTLLLWIVVLVFILHASTERRRLTERIAALERLAAEPKSAGPAVATGERTVEPANEPTDAREAVGRDTGHPVVDTKPAPSGTIDPSVAHAPVTHPTARVAPPRIVWPKLSLPRINVPAVVGVVISLLGFSFLLKLALDQGWLQLPIGIRHLLVDVAGAGMVAAGWRLRHGPRAYSRTLIGGGIATLCLTIYSAVLVFELIPGAFGFGLLLAIVVSAGALASALGSRTLAVMGLVGGLTAPLLLPAGAVGLAEILLYYLLFSTVTLGLAMRHDWRLLDALAFCGTFGSAVLWAAYHRSSGSTSGITVQLAIVGLFATFVGIALAATGRRRARFSLAVERLLLLGTPSATLLLFAVVDPDSASLAWRSFAIGALYLAGGRLLRGSHRTGAAHASLLVAAGVAFLALAVPLGLEGEWITVAWGTGAALQVYLAMRHRRRGHAVAATALLGLTAWYHLTELAASALRGATTYFDPTLLSGVWLALAALLSAWWIDRDGRDRGLTRYLRWAPFAIGVTVWLLSNAEQIVQLTHGYRTVAGLVSLLAVTALAGDLVRWPMFRVLNAGYAPALWPMLLAAVAATDHPLVGLGLAAWPFALAVLAVVGRSARGAARSLAAWSLEVVGVAVVLWEIYHQVGDRLHGVWPAAVATTLLAGWLLVRSGRLVPGGAGRGATATLGGTLLLLLATIQFSDGGAPPLAYLPLVNPLDLAAVTALVALSRVLRPYGDREQRAVTIASLATVCLSMTVLRSVHHFAGVPFEAAALRRSMTAQTALTVSWACIGLAAMVLGNLRVRRPMWILGAALMTVVVGKLFVVDLAGVNTGARIVSFLGVGALLLAVGYTAPVPPKQAGTTHSPGRALMR